MLENVFGYTLDNQISELDDHPNEAGHKAIADFLIKELNLWTKTLVGILVRQFN